MPFELNLEGWSGEGIRKDVTGATEWQPEDKMCDLGGYKDRQRFQNA